MDAQQSQTAEASPRKKHRRRRKKTTLKSLKDQIRQLKANQSSNELTAPLASPSSDPAEHPASAQFAEESAAIIAEAGAAPSADAGAQPGDVSEMPGQKLQLPWGMEIDLTQVNVRQHYVPTLFNALAKGFGEEFQIEEWEKEIWAPALTGCANRYLPPLLASTDRPELVLLTMAVASYAGTRIGAIRQLIKQHTSARGKSMAGSLGIPTSSDSPDAAKLT